MRRLLTTLLVLGAAGLMAQGTNPTIVIPSVTISTVDFSAHTTAYDTQAWRDFLLTGTNQGTNSVLDLLVRVAARKREAYPHSMAASWLGQISADIKTNGVWSVTNPSTISIITHLESR